MINFTKELPQNTTVIQSEHTVGSILCSELKEGALSSDRGSTEYNGLQQKQRGTVNSA